MRCPFCRHDETKVLDARATEEAHPSGAGAYAASADALGYERWRKRRCWS